MELFGVAGLAAIGGLGSAAGVGSALAASVDGSIYNHDAAVKYLAGEYYFWDGADGSHDGISDLDRQSYPGHVPL